WPSPQMPDATVELYRAELSRLTNDAVLHEAVAMLVRSERRLPPTAAIRDAYSDLARREERREREERELNAPPPPPPEPRGPVPQIAIDLLHRLGSERIGRDMPGPDDHHGAGRESTS